MKILNKLIYFLFDLIFSSKRNAIIFFSILFSLIILVFFSSSLLILFFIIIGTVSLLHTIITRNYIGFELCTLVTVITAMKFGAFTGGIVGVTSITTGLILSRSIDPGLIVSILGFILIAIVASFFSFNEIVFVGVILAIVYDAILAIFYYFSGSNPFTILSFSLTHVLLNYVVFTTLSPFFIGLVS